MNEMMADALIPPESKGEEARIPSQVMGQSFDASSGGPWTIYEKETGKPHVIKNFIDLRTVLQQGHYVKTRDECVIPDAAASVPSVAPPQATDPNPTTSPVVPQQDSPVTVPPSLEVNPNQGATENDENRQRPQMGG